MIQINLGKLKKSWLMLWLVLVIGLLLVVPKPVRASVYGSGKYGAGGYGNCGSNCPSPSAVSSATGAGSTSPKPSSTTTSPVPTTLSPSSTQEIQEETAKTSKNKIWLIGLGLAALALGLIIFALYRRRARQSA